MSKAIVARPVNGITINGDLEFLLDDGGEVSATLSSGEFNKNADHISKDVTCKHKQ